MIFSDPWAWTAQRLQERASSATPVEHVERVGGWWLRHSPTSSWRTATVLPHGAATHEKLSVLIASAEQFYREHAARSSFQLTPGACPTTLDASLAERGYYRHTPMSLQTARTADVQARTVPDDVQVQLTEHPTDAWLELWHTIHGAQRDRPSERHRLEQVARPSGYVCVLRKGTVLAVGRAVADTGWAGVFGMATRADSRGKGVARSVLISLANWARQQRASGMYLQVDKNNAPALQLYRGMGFTEVCGYHYRTEPGKSQS